MEGNGGRPLSQSAQSLLFALYEGKEVRRARDDYGHRKGNGQGTSFARRAIRPVKTAALNGASMSAGSNRSLYLTASLPLTKTNPGTTHIRGCGQEQRRMGLVGGNPRHLLR